ncbi:hypothetical protein [Pseudaestuariivita sp.]|uniref:hypothetical protein n=1 Tax=Pseudaestuariivita sp. TaxID=2211669 RepID=UPI0040598543
MTLISIQSRIHFAAHVLEEALRAELEQAGSAHVLVLSEAAPSGSELSARVAAGLPNRGAITRVEIFAQDTKYDVSARVLADGAACKAQAIVAYGSARAIAFARKCRQEIAKQRYGAVPAQDRKTLRERSFLPDFYVIPGLDGLPDPCTTTASGRTDVKIAPPSVIICDPTILDGASEEGAASSYANTLGRCLEALVSEDFNPIADGYAVEGLQRLVLARPRPDTTRAGQNLMAASLLSALAQQKGPGALQLFTAALAGQTGRAIDAGAVRRILAPRLFGDPAMRDFAHEKVVRAILGLPQADAFAGALDKHLDPLPLARQFADMGLARDDVQAAADVLRGTARCPVPPPERLEAILEASY